MRSGCARLNLFGVEVIIHAERGQCDVIKSLSITLKSPSRALPSDRAMVNVAHFVPAGESIAKASPYIASRASISSVYKQK